MPPPVMLVHSRRSVPKVEPWRQLHRSFHVHYLERVQSYHQTPAYQKALRKRQVWIEPLFAEAKDWHGMRRFRLRLLWRVNCEALRIAAGQNLKRLLKKRGWGRRSFPTEAMAMASPPNWEPEKSPRPNLLKSPSVAVASLVAYGAAKTFFEPQTSWFSLEITILSLFYLLSYFHLNALLSSLLPVLLLSRSKRVFEPSSSSAFSEAQQGLFQQAGASTRRCKPWPHACQDSSASRSGRGFDECQMCWAVAASGSNGR